MDITEETPIREITINHVPGFPCPEPFTEGHVCKPNEASALNQLLAENSRNNFSSEVNKVRDLWEKDEAGDPILPEDLSELFASYSAHVLAYEFGVRTGGGRTGDPVKTLARQICRQKLLKRLKAQGTKASDVSKDAMNALIDKALERNPHLMDLAKQQIELSKNAEFALD